jgi:hypothetical protein
MNKKEIIKKIGSNNWKKFINYIRGQTVNINTDGTIDYNTCDVERFSNNIKGGLYD